MSGVESSRLWETVAAKIIERYSKMIYDVQIACENSCTSDDFIKAIPFPIQLSSPCRFHTDSFELISPGNKVFINSVSEKAASSTKRRDFRRLR